MIVESQNVMQSDRKEQARPALRQRRKPREGAYARVILKAPSTRVNVLLRTEPERTRDYRATGNSMTDNKRFFISTSGRSGSSLLAAIIDDAGGDFGMKNAARWDTSRGAYQHPDFVLDSGLLYELEARQLDKPPFGLKRFLWLRKRRRARDLLLKAATEAQFIKDIGNVTRVPFYIRYGYRPSIIVSYRNFEDYAHSIVSLWVENTVPSIAPHYISLLTDATALLALFGGCAIDYEEIVDPAQTSWAAALSETTGLPADALLAARDERISTRPRPTHEKKRVPLKNAEAQRIYETLNGLRGQCFPPSSHALRRWSDLYEF